MRARVFKFCIHLESCQVYCGKENRDAEINICLLFPFLLLSISHSNVIHRELFVKDSSGTTAPRILKFDTNVGYDLLHCIREHEPPAAYHFFYLSIFLPPSQIFCYRFLSFYESRSLQVSYTHWEWPSLLWDRKPRCRDLFCHLFPFFPFFISHSNVIHREICVKDISGTTAPRILKFGTNVGYDFVLCKRESPFCCSFFFLFVHFSFSNKTFRHRTLSSWVFKFCIHLERCQVYCGKENEDAVINFCHLCPFFHLSHHCNT